jgi:hypothetical protein
MGHGPWYWPRPHDPPAPRTPFGPQLNDPIRGREEVRVVFHDHDEMTGVGQLMQGAQEAIHIFKTQAPRRLIQ